ncbi:hypothetical protein L5515_015509 [Caenorhabditis briggsae]|uniref:Uncharacterized protein n=1 Tax=Caenorhabditis briggsae TaxID=6238 RepID=A0AAE9EFC5_CAEBR|nr:hypothetical protein L5515_015509 [Caenorhabditis briggsae]
MIHSSTNGIHLHIRTLRHQYWRIVPLFDPYKDFIKLKLTPHQPELSNSIYDPQFAGSSSIFNPENLKGKKKHKLIQTVSFLAAQLENAKKGQLRESQKNLKDTEDGPLMMDQLEQKIERLDTDSSDAGDSDGDHTVRHWKKIKKDERSQWTELWRRMVALQKEQLEDGIVNCRRC